MSNRICFGEPIEIALPPEKLPSDSLLLNQRPTERHSPFQVYIVRQAYDKAWRHVERSSRTECGGILVGHPFRVYDQDITFVVIVDTIAQDSDDHSVGHFTVRPAEIAHTRATLEREGYYAVGWYHSHPGHGVFLSEQDMTIVRSIYDLHWHVAWVMDPQRREESFFYGPTGRRLTGQFLLSKEPEFVKASAMYKQSQDVLRTGEVNIDRAQRMLNQLKVALDSNQDLSIRWQETGRYKDISNALDALSASNEESAFAEESERFLEPSAEQEVAGSEDDLLKISQRYDEAKDLMYVALKSSHDGFPSAAKIRKAHHILEWITRKSPRHRDAARLEDCSKEVLDILDSAPTPPRRLTRSEERKLQRRMEELRSLLRSDHRA